MQKLKIKWKVSSIPTGRYSSFTKRGWPIAEYEDGRPCAAIYCEDRYEPSWVKTGSHESLTIRIAYYHTPEEKVEHGAFTWKTLKKKAATLREAKDLVVEFLGNHPEFYANKEASNAQR